MRQSIAYANEVAFFESKGAVNVEDVTESIEGEEREWIGGRQWSFAMDRL